ncbi:MAG: hypothetical protein EA379_05640 [Phycisphaerales bacterium]|nr:MAG: hypothetical protein EA379_05640 [Phycisphaerales bacterium]
MHRTATALSATALALTGAGALATLPDYDQFEIQCRSSFTNPFNLPNGAFFTNSTPSINDSAQVAINVGTIQSQPPGSFFGAQGSGSLAYQAPSGGFLSDTVLNNNGFIVTPLSDVTPYGIVRIDTNTMTNSIAVSPGLPFGIEAFTSPQINDNGQIGYRGRIGFIGNVFVSWDNGSQAIHAAEVGVDPNSPYSFIFTPSFNNQRQIAAKVRLGGPGQTGNNQPDQIRVFNSDGSSTLYVEDIDSDPSSPFTNFDNSVALTNNGLVAFIAPLVGGGRGVFLSDGTTVTTIATENASPLVSSIEFFGPAANDNGLVAFRAFDNDGRRAIFVGDGTNLKRVVGHLDIVPTDLGDARIQRPDTSPVFGGSIRINSNGDIAFAASLTDPDNSSVSFGSGVFIAYAGTTIDCPGDFTGDNVVDFADLSEVLSDFGGAYDFADLSLVLANFGADCN